MTDQDDTLKPGDEIAEYQVESILGSGSFGVTYLARDTHLRRAVAVKEYMPVMYARRSADGSIASRNLDTAATFEWGLERFSEEARTLAQFNHPNIVRVLRLVQGVNGTAYIAMELLEGVNLESLVEKEGPLEPDRFLSIFRQILDGCESIHKIGILHRDIKPANIVLRGDTPILIDFGAARELSLQRKAGFSALVTDGFSPMEQYSRETGQTESTDIYALSATAYFLLTGTIPPPSAARMVGDSMQTAAAAAAGRVPDDILRGIDWGMKLAMKDRPATIAEWRAAMPSLEAKAASDAPRPQQVEERLPLSRRAMLLAGGGVIVAGGAAFLLLRRDTSLVDTATPLKVDWGAHLCQLSPIGDPYPAIAAASGTALIAAHEGGAEGADRLLALRVAGSGAVTGKFLFSEAGSRGHSVLPAADGGAFVGGDSGGKAVLVRLDRDWKLSWTKTFAEGSISSIMSDGENIVAGMEGAELSGTAKLLYVDAGGNLGNELTVLDRQGDSVQGIIRLGDGGVAVLGMRQEQRLIGGQARDTRGLWVARFGKDGVEQWRVQEKGLGNANGWAIAEANGELYVLGRTFPDTPDHEEDQFHMLLMRINGQGKKLWSKSDYGVVPSSGRGLAVARRGGSSALYLAGWAGSPAKPRWSQIGPDGTLVWDQIEKQSPGSRAVGGLALDDNGVGFGIGLDAQEDGTRHLSLVRLTY